METAQALRLFVAAAVEILHHVIEELVLPADRKVNNRTDKREEEDKTGPNYFLECIFGSAPVDVKEEDKNEQDKRDKNDLRSTQVHISGHKVPFRIVYKKAWQQMI